MVLWLVGLSGAGKSSIARVLVDLWKRQRPQTVLLDGDDLRAAVDGRTAELSFTREARSRRETRTADLCAVLERQGFDVICALNSIEQSVRDRNRRCFDRYFEVYVSTPLDVCLTRDREQHYLAALRGERDDVVGLDLDYEAPRSPDMIVDNGHPAAEPALIARHIAGAAQRKLVPQEASVIAARKEAFA
ncbi:MAG TPA: adenylyl-sulfate kinase [Candidatus Krumholzibacteria bacterium]|nr:adenylyl-sulfate kinase [Candidatus Krumholzibacteria bacterium]